MDDTRAFSDRHGVRPKSREVDEWQTAPDKVRSLVGYAARQSLSLERVRDIFCAHTGNVPNLDNWSDENVWRECIGLLNGAAWYEVYDIAEEVWAKLPPSSLRAQSREDFTFRLNRTLEECGIGWKMNDGRLEARGESGFEMATGAAEQFLEDSGRATARAELEEALRDLARRPAPDETGAIQHSMAALECFVRDLTGQPGATLGSLVKQEADRLELQKPLDSAIHKMWGYASQMGRHIEEGKKPSRKEAKLVVTFASALIVFFSAGDV